MNRLTFMHTNILQFEKVEILQILRVHDLYTNKRILLATLYLFLTGTKKVCY